MKTINVSDEDYKDLMDLIKELKTQEHDSQAYPRMWTIDTTHERVTKEGYGDNFSAVLGHESYSTMRIEELNDKLLKAYKENSSLETFKEEYEEFIVSVENFKDWCKEKNLKILDVLDGDGSYTFLTDYLEDAGADIVPIEEYDKHELNATLFKSDAKNYIKFNGHNLYKNPHTYAFTPFRMPKMNQLVDILMRLNGKKDENKEWL